MANNPIPQGNYHPAVRYQDLIYTAGMTPRKDGVLLIAGQIDPALPVETYKEGAEQAARNALTAARNCLEEGEKIGQILALTVYLNAPAGYTTHAKVGDLVSNWLAQELGQGGIAPRATVGVASLPGNAPIEVQIVAAAAR